MTSGPDCLALITHFEGFRATSYQDVAGIWTIGYGTTRVEGRPVTAGMTCTSDQAKVWLKTDVIDAERSVTQSCRTTLTQYQFDALVCLVYNIGVGNFLKSSILRVINAGGLGTSLAGPLAVTEAQFTAWNKVRQGAQLVEMHGLTRRRKSEYHLYSMGTVQFF